MSRRAVFWRMVTSSTLCRHSRILIAILVVAIGATTLPDLVTIAIGVPAQLAQEVYSYGVNLVAAPTGDVPITDETVVAAAAQVPVSALVGSAISDYEMVTINDQPYVAGGADLEAVYAMNSYWYVDGEWPAATGQIPAGEQVASTIDAKAGDMITVSQLDAGTSPEGAQVQSGAPAPGLKVDPCTVTLTVSGIPKTGGNEDSYVHMSKQDMSTLTGQTGVVSLAEYSIALEGDQLSAIADAMNAASLDVHAQTVHRLAQSDTGVLAILHSLLVVITVIVLVLIMIGVFMTMIIVITERRNEIGLRKALGAIAQSITRGLMGEGVMLGLVGGLLGAGAGYGLVVLISTFVFYRSISLHPVILLGMVACSVLIVILACLPPVHRVLTVDPAFTLHGE